MRKINFSRVFLATLTLLVMVVTSCKKDDPFVKPKLSFSTSTLTVNEDAEVIEIEVSIDKAFTENISIEYKLGGTAVNKVDAGSNTAYDYEVTSEYLEVDIAKGETKGIIEIKVYSDFLLEDPETIEIELESVNNESIELTSEDDMEVTITQEDGLFVLLQWGVGPGETYTDVDMDLFLWFEVTGVPTLTNVSSARASFASPEFFFLPTALLDDGNYGLSCNYYEGTKDPMNFVVTFVEIVDNDDVATTEKQGTYALANINAWDQPPPTGSDLQLVVSFAKSGADYTNFSDITEPVSGSRTMSSALPKGVVKLNAGGPIPAVVKALMK